MGLISKLEDKITGSDKHDEQKKLEKQGTSSTYEQGIMTSDQQRMTSGQHGGTSGMQNTTSGGRAAELQHPISSTTGHGGSGIVGGTAVTGGAGSEALMSSGTHGYGHEGNVSSTSDKLRDTHLGSSTGSDGPRQPYNPYSSKGQQIAANAGSTPTGGYGASQGRAEAGDIGSRRSADDPEVRRTHGGGISNQVTEGFTTGPHSHLENRDAVPTAGGQKVGSGTTSSTMPGSYDTYDNSPSTTQSQHHYGRDAALAGGAGAAGYGAYEATHRGDSTGPAPNTAGPHKSDMLNKIDPRVEADPSKSHYGRDSGVSGVGSDKHHDKHSHNTHSSTTTHSTTTHPSSTTASSYEPSGIDRRSYDTSGKDARYGQDVSYMNRPQADTPLTHNKDFSERHPHGTALGAAGAGAGAGALGASALSHKQGDVSDSRNVSGASYGAQNPSTTHTTSGHGSTVPGGAGSMGSTTSPTTSSLDHATMGSELAKRMGGAYESGYRDGYRDAMAHKAAQV